MDATQSLFTEHQVNTILLLLIFAGLVGLLLVVFYMLDRVNELHKHSGVTLTGHTPLKPDESFGGLSGKALWDAMAGIPMPGWSVGQLEALKPRYEAVLQKHMEMLFEDGQLDGREGFSMPVRCDRFIATLRGEIASWIPHEYATVVYRSGHDLATKPEEERAEIRARLEQTGAAVFASTGMPPHSLANLLMPIVPAPAATDAADPEQETAALSLAAPVDELALQLEAVPATPAQAEDSIALDLSASADKPAEATPAAPAAVPAEAAAQPVKS